MKLTRKTVALSLLTLLPLAIAACGSDPAAVPTAPVVTQSNSVSRGDAAGSATPADTPAGSPTAEGAPLSGTLSGAGASSQNSAVTAWIAGYNVGQPAVTVNYDAVGSGDGRKQFLSGAVAFAGSDSPLSDEELVTSTEVCGPGGAIDIPVYISPIAVPFNVAGLTELNLRPATLAAIFDNRITRWNDPALAADNPGADLPDLEIIPVHRSDDSGTSKNFAQYLAAAAGDDWPYEASDTWPVEGEAANGTSGVIGIVGDTNGAIGYADASAVGQLPTAAIGVGDDFTRFSPEAAAAVVDESEQIAGRGEFDLALELARDTTTSGAYPIVLVSYHLVCSNYADAATGDLVRSFLNFVISPEGQDAAAEAAGSAPISDALRDRAQASVDSITAG